MNNKDLAKLEYLAISNKIKNVKLLKRRTAKRLSKAQAKKSNSTEYHHLKISEYDKYRNLQKRNARALHLARAFCKGLPYKLVEGYTREGNEPNENMVTMFVLVYRENKMDISNLGNFNKAVKDWLSA